MNACSALNHATPIPRMIAFYRTFPTFPKLLQAVSRIEFLPQSLERQKLLAGYVNDFLFQTSV